MNKIPHVAIVIGSTRPNRICPTVASFVLSEISKDSGVKYTTLDLADINLPLLDEPHPAAQERYQKEHTKTWSQTVKSIDGFIFVLPQYNWGYPAATKNAIDFLYFEWANKPVSMITYGSHGGERAAVQFAQVLQGVQMQVLSGAGINITHDDYNSDWQIKDIDSILSTIIPQIKVIDKEFRNILLGNTSE